MDRTISIENSIRSVKEGCRVVILRDCEQDGVPFQEGTILPVTDISREISKGEKKAYSNYTMFIEVKRLNSHHWWLRNEIWQLFVEEYDSCVNCESSCKGKKTCPFFTPIYSKEKIEELNKKGV